MMSLLAADLRQRVPFLRENFLKAEPFPHVLIENFVGASFLDRLAGEFPAFDRQKAISELGTVGGKSVHQNLPELGEAYRELDGILRSKEFLDLVGEITSIPDLQYDPVYIGGGTHENCHGQDLDPHVDFNYHPTTQLHRRLNLILFLNPEWREEWGGSLQVHSDPWEAAGPDRSKSYLPLLNHCVLFETSEVSWHGFPRIDLPEEKRHLSRRSIAVYFYTKERPKEETAPDHSTVYVQRRLSSKFAPGRTLDEQDARELQIAIDRRDQQIRFLYEREKEFSEVIAGYQWKVGEKDKEIAKLVALNERPHEELAKLEREHADMLGRIFHSPTFRLGHALIWPLRVAKGLFGS
jgi:Rps23 Pro-64 3,4-dihydroxylase Tpa1-like proline 4-hydroxylase